MAAAAIRPAWRAAAEIGGLGFIADTPQLISHYTDMVGLRGIIGNGGFRVVSIQHVRKEHGEKRELWHGRDFTLSLLGRMVAEVEYTSLRPLLTRTIERMRMFDPPSNDEYCVSCFTQKTDSVYHRETYAQDRGVRIEFDPLTNRRSQHYYTFRELEPVLYEDARKDEVIRGHVDWFRRRAFLDGFARELLDGSLYEHLFRELWVLFIRFKHISLARDEEIRLVSIKGAALKNVYRRLHEDRYLLTSERCFHPKLRIVNEPLLPLTRVGVCKGDGAAARLAEAREILSRARYDPRLAALE